jgi:sugar (pentulose or hexulose) kinase
MAEPLVLGVDLGTGGVRALAATATGHVVAHASAETDATVRPTGRGHEQSPHVWWQNARNCLEQLQCTLRDRGYAPEHVHGLAVDGTSGTLLAVDAAGEPIRPALMYNDARATVEAAELNDRARAWCAAAGYRIEPSFALAKIVWLQQRENESFARASRFIHQADYIVGRLTGNFSVTDYSNALKTGYDLVHERWPDWLAALPGIAERLPLVVAPGTVVGEVSAEAAASTGLRKGLPVVAGATDGVAAAVAAGVRRTGDYNTTLGTTLVFKGVSSQPTNDPHGLIYAHKLPGNRWLPGAASNCGAGWIRAWYPGRSPEELDRAASAYLPSRKVAYPLVGRGERFPFRSISAERFCDPAAANEAEEFAAYLTGTALVERAAYERLDQVCQTSGGDVYSTGGGSKSDLWMQCRADITGRIIHRPQVAESAFGSAILAAAGTVFSALDEATMAMAHEARSFEPAQGKAVQCDELYLRFRDELRRRGYLTDT